MRKDYVIESPALRKILSASEAKGEVRGRLVRRAAVFVSTDELFVDA